MRAFNKTAPQYPQEATITRLSASAHVHPCSPMQQNILEVSQWIINDGSDASLNVETGTNIML